MSLNYQAAVNISAIYDGKGVDQATNSFKKFDGTVKGTLSGLASLKSTLGGLAGAYGAYKLLEFTKGIVDLGEEFYELKKKTGIGVQALSDLKTVADLNGVAFDQLEAGLRKFSVTFTKAQNGSGKSIAGFAALGLDPKSFKNSDDAILSIAEKFRLADDGAAKAAVAVALFGKSGSELIPLLNKGRDGIKGLGLQMSDNFVDDSHKFNEELKKSEENLKSIGVTVLSFVLPALNGMFKSLKDFDGPNENSPSRRRFHSDAFKYGSAGPQPFADRTGLADARQADDRALSESKKKTKIDTTKLGGEDNRKKIEEELKVIEKYKDGLKELTEQFALEQDQVNLSKVAFEEKKVAIEENAKAEKATVGFTKNNKAAYEETTKKIIEQKDNIIEWREAQKQAFGPAAKEAMRTYVDNAKDTAAQTKNLFAGAFSGIEDALVSFVKTGKLSLADLGRTLSDMLLHIAIQKSIAYAVTSAGFADGGIMTSSGPTKLRKYSSGGIANSPQLALFGEGRTPEAYVPLPDGRNIPVMMKGGGSGGGVSVVQTITISQNGESSDSTKSSTDKGKQLGNVIKAAVLQTIVEQRRPGGVLA